MTQEELGRKISKIIEKYCTEVPYEGTEVNKADMADALVDLFKTLSFSDLNDMAYKTPEGGSAIPL